MRSPNNKPTSLREPDITKYSNTTTPRGTTGRCCVSRKRSSDPYKPTPTPGGEFERVTAVIAWGKRPVPFRTRKLRPTAPMVLHSRGCGRVGHRRTQPPRMARATTPGPSLHHQRNSPHSTSAGAVVVKSPSRAGAQTHPHPRTTAPSQPAQGCSCLGHTHNSIGTLSPLDQKPDPARPRQGTGPLISCAG